MKIASVVARQLLDCKARPLVEVEITTDTGHVGRGASPTGSSVGIHEAFVLRDGDRAEYIESAVETGVSLFGVLGEVLAGRLGRAPLVASSYGYVAPSSDPRVVMEVLAEAVERAGCADAMAFALDCASSEVYDESTQT